MRLLPSASHSQHTIDWGRLRRHLWSAVALVFALRLLNAIFFANHSPDIMIELCCIALGGWLAIKAFGFPAKPIGEAPVRAANHQSHQKFTRG